MSPTRTSEVKAVVGRSDPVTVVDTPSEDTAPVPATFEIVYGKLATGLEKAAVTVSI
jgi:hypothetical protein